MKKVFLFVGLCAVSFYGHTDIIIRGIAKDIENASGNTYVSCKGRKGACVIIETPTTTTPHGADGGRKGFDVLVPNANMKISCSDYAVQKVGDAQGEETKVTLFNVD